MGRQQAQFALQTGNVDRILMRRWHCVQFDPPFPFLPVAIAYAWLLTELTHLLIATVTRCCALQRRAGDADVGSDDRGTLAVRQTAPGACRLLRVDAWVTREKGIGPALKMYRKYGLSAGNRKSIVLLMKNTSLCIPLWHPNVALSPPSASHQGVAPSDKGVGRGAPRRQLRANDQHREVGRSRESHTATGTSIALQQSPPLAAVAAHTPAAACVV